MKYAIRFYEVSMEDGRPLLRQTDEIQIHKLINAALILSHAASVVNPVSTSRIAKFFIRERGRYREISIEDWSPEVHERVEMDELNKLLEKFATNAIA